MKKKRIEQEITVGVLALQGGVVEHIRALTEAGEKLRVPIAVREVRTKDDLIGLAGIVLPGGESTTLGMLLRRAKMFHALSRVPAIFGTCAGAILLAKGAKGKTEGQETLELMDISVDRNAYGTQLDSFEKDIATAFGRIRAVFIRAPRITRLGKGVQTVATDGEETVACEETHPGRYYLASSFHPELTGSQLHQHFIRNLLKIR